MMHTCHHVDAQCCFEICWVLLQQHSKEFQISAAADFYDELLQRFYTYFGNSIDIGPSGNEKRCNMLMFSGYSSEGSSCSVQFIEMSWVKYTAAEQFRD